MSWSKEVIVRDEGDKIVVEYKLQAIPSDIGIDKLGPGAKVRITTSDVVSMLASDTDYKIGNLIEQPLHGEVKNYFFDDRKMVSECWIFEKVKQAIKKKPASPTTKSKNMKKVLANKTLK